MSTDAEFVEEYRPLVASIAHKLRAAFDLRAEMDDLIAEGMAGLLEAKSRFDPSRGVQFNTFAYYRIRGAMIDSIRRDSNLSRRAHRKRQEALAALEIGEQLGEARAADPKSRTDAKATLEAMHQTLAKLTTSFVLSAVGQDEAPETPEERVLSEEAKVRVRGLLDTLPERERKLVEGFYFDGRQFDEVAAEIGISKSWASRLHTKALDRLRAALTAE